MSTSDGRHCRLKNGPEWAGNSQAGGAGADESLYYLNGLLVGPVPSAPPACLWGKLLVLSPYLPHLSRAESKLDRTLPGALSLALVFFAVLISRAAAASLSLVCDSRVRILARSLAGGNLGAQTRTGRLGRSRGAALRRPPKGREVRCGCCSQQLEEAQPLSLREEVATFVQNGSEVPQLFVMEMISLKNGLCFIWCLF